MHTHTTYIYNVHIYIYIYYGPVSGGPPPGMVGWACTSQFHGLSLMYLCFFLIHWPIHLKWPTSQTNYHQWPKITDQQLITNGFPMIFQWFSCDFPMVFLWFSYGFPVIFLWFSYDFPMVFQWFSYGFPVIFLWFSCDFPMVFLWFSYGFPVISLWFSCDFPMVFQWKWPSHCYWNHHSDSDSSNFRASQAKALRSRAQDLPKTSWLQPETKREFSSKRYRYKWYKYRLYKESGFIWLMFVLFFVNKINMRFFHTSQGSISKIEVMVTIYQQNRGSNAPNNGYQKSGFWKLSMKNEAWKVKTTVLMLLVQKTWLAPK